MLALMSSATVSSSALGSDRSLAPSFGPSLTSRMSSDRRRISSGSQRTLSQSAERGDRGDPDRGRGDRMGAPGTAGATAGGVIGGGGGGSGASEGVPLGVALAGLPRRASFKNWFCQKRDSSEIEKRC